MSRPLVISLWWRRVQDLWKQGKGVESPQRHRYLRRMTYPDVFMARLCREREGTMAAACQDMDVGPTCACREIQAGW